MAGDGLQIGQEAETFFLGEMFDDVERDAGIEALGWKKLREPADVSEVDLVVGVALAGLFDAGGVAVESGQVITAEQADVGTVAAADIQNGAAPAQGLAKGEPGLDLARIEPTCDEFAEELGTRDHGGVAGVNRLWAGRLF